MINPQCPMMMVKIVEKLPNIIYVIIFTIKNLEIILVVPKKENRKKLNYFLLENFDLTLK